MAALTEAVFAIDARTGLVNLGTGGTALTPTSGSSSGADSNDPTYLAHTGTNYLYLPGVVGNRVTAQAVSGTGNVWSITMAIDTTGQAPGEYAGYYMRGSGAADSDGFSQLNGVNLRWIYADGTGSASNANTAINVPIGAYWLRATVDATTTTAAVTFESAPLTDLVTIPVSGWTTYHSASVSTTSTGVKLSATLTPTIGQWPYGSVRNLVAKVYRVVEKLDGTVVFDADFTTGITSGAQTSFTASTGQTVTINRSTSGQKAVAVTRPCWLFGTSKYLEVADNALLDFAAGEPFTALLAVRRWATMGASNVYIAKQNQVATAAPAGWLVRGGAATATQVVAHIHDGTNNTATSAPGTLTAGSLTVVGGVRDVTADQVRSFIGSSVASNTDSTTGSSANSEVLRIGRLSGSGTNYIDMELFAVAIWRRALSAAEIADMSTALTNAVLRPTVPDELALTLNTQPGDLLLASQPNDVVLHTTPKGLVLE